MAMSEAEVKAMVGLALAEAERQVTAQGSYVQVLSEDGVSFPCLTMYDPNRVCVHVEKGKVIAAVIS